MTRMELAAQVLEGFPLSPQQRRLWALRGAPGAAGGQVAGVVAIRGELDRAALRRAVGVLASRHESLRTTF
ncbi:MAG: hypothetical protein JOZ15_12360, partial [Acidobacteria bacterium]|nr:hypothetical protein [Acidobacteriota bacterium]